MVFLLRRRHRPVAKLLHGAAEIAALGVQLAQVLDRHEVGILALLVALHAVEREERTDFGFKERGVLR